MSFEFWPARAATLADLRATVRGWHTRSVRLTQKTDDFGDVAFLIDGEFYGHVVEVTA